MDIKNFALLQYLLYYDEYYSIVYLSFMLVWFSYAGSTVLIQTSDN